MTNSIESLHTFASNNNEIEFAHLCTAALAGEEWAVERIQTALRAWASTAMAGKRSELRLTVIRATDTTRPDGAVARKFEI